LSGFRTPGGQQPAFDQASRRVTIQAPNDFEISVDGPEQQQLVKVRTQPLELALYVPEIRTREQLEQDSHDARGRLTRNAQALKPQDPRARKKQFIKGGARRTASGAEGRALGIAGRLKRLLDVVPQV